MPYKAIDGKQKGPYDISKFKGMAVKGDFDKDSLVWKEGMDNWTRAGDLEEFSSVFGAIAPPIPED